MAIADMVGFGSKMSNCLCGWALLQKSIFLSTNKSYILYPAPSTKYTVPVLCTLILYHVLVHINPNVLFILTLYPKHCKCTQKSFPENVNTILEWQSISLIYQQLSSRHCKSLLLHHQHREQLATSSMYRTCTTVKGPGI